MKRAYGKIPLGVRVFEATYMCDFQVPGVGRHSHEFTVPWIPNEGETKEDIPRVIPCIEHRNRTADLVVRGIVDQK